MIKISVTVSLAGLVILILEPLQQTLTIVFLLSNERFYLASLIGYLLTIVLNMLAAKWFEFPCDINMKGKIAKIKNEEWSENSAKEALSMIERNKASKKCNLVCLMAG